MQISPGVSRPIREKVRAARTRHVIACVDCSEHARTIAAHARAIARALRVPLTLLQVLEMQSGKDLRPDPIECDIRRHEARMTLKRLAEACEKGDETIDTRLVEGLATDEICRWTKDRTAELVVFGTQGESGIGKHRIGSTARSVLEQAGGSVLLVPVATTSPHDARYRRILVPVDGSSWAESVMPLAVRLADGSGAELVIAHVVPVPELTETGPLEAEDVELRERVIERNERVARAYLDRVRSYAVKQGLGVRAVVLRGEDVRSGLIDLIDAERVDLVLLSARGHGGNRVPDVPYGNVAAYLMTHSPVPMLIVRSVGSTGRGDAPLPRNAGRLPARPGR